MNRRFLLTMTALLLSCSAPALADGVSVRVGEHDGYARLVFDGAAGASYAVSQDSDSSLIVSFTKPLPFDKAGFNADGLPQVTDVTQLSAPGEKLKVKVGLHTPGTQFRHFMAGNRVIVDILEPGKAAMPQPKQAPQQEAKKPAPAAPVPAPVKEAKKPEPALAPAAVPPVKTEEKKTAPVKEAAKTPETPETPAAAPKAKNEISSLPPRPAEPVTAEKLDVKTSAIPTHTLALSLTESVGMAAFERNDYLWVVLDSPNIIAPPEVIGPDRESFGPFTRYEVSGGVAFRMKLPHADDTNLYGEGGGLVWRIVMTSDERHSVPVEMQRSFVQGEYVRGGTVFWPLLETSRVIDVPDPGTGDVLKVVPVRSASQFTGEALDLVDFATMRSVIGIAVKPKIDDLAVKLTGNGVQVSRPGGLALSRPKDITRRQMREDVTEAAIKQPAEENQKIRRIYDFDRWMMGGLQAMSQNQRILMANSATKDKNGRVQDLLTLAKISVANDRGQEALGFLNYAADELPELADGAEFRALRGAAYALAGKFELAMQDFLAPDLKDYTEIDYWRAYTLAWLEDWQQAKAAMPADYSVLVGYPKALLEKLGIKLAEVALRSGDVASAEKILAVLAKDRAALKPWTIAGMDYLKGEAHRQSGEFDSAIALWEPLSKGKDDFYRARAGLALTMLQLQQGKTDRKDAIDRLEGLRYAWRGDELESQINFMLGKLYLEDRQYLKGFGILRDAAGMSPDSDINGEIVAYMADSFKNLLMEDKDISPLDAVTVYEQFNSLTPAGDEGNKLVQKLAERVVEADLLTRAAGILQGQVDSRLQGMEKAQVATRLAALYLLDKQPQKAIAAIDAAKPVYEQAGTPESQKAVKNLELMRARAMSQMDHTEEALALLAKFDPTPDVNRLRADIAWQAGLWEDAAEALQDLILDEALDLGRPLTQKQADLILNRSVALNLSGNRVALANMRQRYEDAMKKTPRARLFDVVTRPRQSTLLSDRQTLDSLVSEVDIFKDFLEAYRSQGASPPASN